MIRRPKDLPQPKKESEVSAFWALCLGQREANKIALLVDIGFDGCSVKLYYIEERSEKIMALKLS